MSQVRTSFVARLGSFSTSNLNGLSPEAEIRSLCTLAPEATSYLPSLFAQAVVESCSSIAGASAGEALVRRIGDGRLQNPQEVFKRIDYLLQGGSETLKKAIERGFRIKVHRFYKISMNVAMRPIPQS